MPFGNDAVVMEGVGITVIVTDAVFVVSPAAVATIVTVIFAVTDAGALYIAADVVTLVNVPQALPVQLLPDMVQATPWAAVSLASVAEIPFCCPCTIVTAVPGVRETVIAGLLLLPLLLLLPPQPENVAANVKTKIHDSHLITKVSLLGSETRAVHRRGACQQGHPRRHAVHRLGTEVMSWLIIVGHWLEDRKATIAACVTRLLDESSTGARRDCLP